MDRAPSNWFVRTLIVLFCCFLGGLVVFRFFFISPQGEITSGLLILLAFVLVLVLSELFDNFSVGKLVTMSRTLKEKEEQKAELKRENSELRSQLITVTTSVSQRQTSNTIFGMPEEMVNLIKVRKAPDDEVAKKRSEEATQEAVQEATRLKEALSNFESSSPRPIIDRAKAEDLAIGRFVAERKLEAYGVIREAKLSMRLAGLDPITSDTPIFDAYVNTEDAEIFVEVKQYGTLGIGFRDRLYVLLAKINHYKSLKKTNAYLTLIVTKFPNDEERRFSSLRRVEDLFEPAVASGLLRIHLAEFDEADARGLYRPD